MENTDSPPPGDHPDRDTVVVSASSRHPFDGLQISDTILGLCYQRPASASLPIVVHNMVHAVRGLVYGICVHLHILLLLHENLPPRGAARCHSALDS